MGGYDSRQPHKHPRDRRGLANSPLKTPKQIGTAMTQVKSGDTVRVHYTGTLTDGQTFDSSEGRDPLEFVVGSGQIIPGLDAAMEGMAVGEKKTVEVPADQAYGHPDPNAQQAVPRAESPEDIPLDLGTQLQVQTPQGQVMPVTVVDVTEEQVVLDANHPLAGKDLTFAIELVDIT
jgi:peptidylprolyl isomerase